jgi:hypothetical protein
VKPFHFVTLMLMAVVIYYAEIYGLLAEMRSWQAGTWIIYTGSLLFVWVFAMMTMRIS